MQFLGLRIHTFGVARWGVTGLFAKLSAELGDTPRETKLSSCDGLCSKDGCGAL